MQGLRPQRNTDGHSTAFGPQPRLIYRRDRRDFVSEHKEIAEIRGDLKTLSAPTACGDISRSVTSPISPGSFHSKLLL